METAASSWFALQTRPRSEKKVEYLLSQKGYKCLLPMYRQQRQWSDRVVKVDLPLFPMYIFCCFSPSVLGKAVSTPGVTRIVGFNGRPAEIDEKEIEALQRLSQSSLLREPWRHIPNGTLVKVKTGPLAGVQGIFSSVDGKQRLVLSVTLLQQSVMVQLDEDTIISVVEGQKKSKGVNYDKSHLALKLIGEGRTMSRR